MNENEQKNKEKATLGESILSYAMLVILAFVIASGIKFVLEPTAVSGLSMYPTFDDGDKIVLNRFDTWFTDTDRGDEVVFNWEAGDKLLIKRVIAVAGDEIVINSDGVFLNGEKLEEAYINPAEDMIMPEEEIDVVVPEGYVFAMGDNRNHSMDSRFAEIGLVPEDEILGSVLARYSPVGKIDENHLD